MYAILEDGGKQYRVAQGDVIDLETREIPEGENTIELDRVLLLHDEQGTRVGTPTLPGAKIIARIDGLIKGNKLKMLKFRRRKDSSTRKGHRQKYLRVTIADIVAPT